MERTGKTRATSERKELGRWRWELNDTLCSCWLRFERRSPTLTDYTDCVTWSAQPHLCPLSFISRLVYLAPPLPATFPQKHCGVSVQFSSASESA